MNPLQIVTITMTTDQLADAISAAVERAVAPLRQEIKDLTQSDDKMLSLTDAAKRAGVSANTIRDYILIGRLHRKSRQVLKLQAATTTGGHYRVKVSDLEAYMALFQIHATPQTYDTPATYKTKRP